MKDTDATITVTIRTRASWGFVALQSVIVAAAALLGAVAHSVI